MILILNIENCNPDMFSPKIDKIGSMSMKAAGAYLNSLREHHNLSLTEVAKSLKTSSSLIFRVEQGQGETRGSILFGYTRLVKGSQDDIANLLLDPNAVSDDGRALAKNRIEFLQGSAPEPILVHPEIIHLIEKLSAYNLGKWVAMGQHLLQENKNK